MESQTTLVWAQSRVELHTVSAIDLADSLVVLPDDAELNHTLRDLDDIKSLLILGVRLEERLKRLSELVESLEISPLRQGILIVISEKSTANLLKLGFDWEDHCDCSKRGFESRKRRLMMIPPRAFC